MLPKKRCPYQFHPFLQGNYERTMNVHFATNRICRCSFVLFCFVVPVVSALSFVLAICVSFPILADIYVCPTGAKYVVCSL